MTFPPLDQISPLRREESFSKIARKLRRDFAACARDHDETGNFVAENFGQLKANDRPPWEALSTRPQPGILFRALPLSAGTR